MKIRKIFSKAVSITAAAVMAIGVSAVSTPIVSQASTVNEFVNADKNGVVEIEVHYKPTGEEDSLVQTGTGFLINDTTLLTCSHVINVDDDYKDILEMIYDDEFDEDYVSVQIVALGDVTEKATVIVDSPEYDYSILSVPDNALRTRSPLTLSSCENVTQTQDVFALGFPWIVSINQSNKTYAPFGKDDVTITNGKISKIHYPFSEINGSYGYENPNGMFIQHGAPLSEGYSGGPLVDEYGNVIGINALTVGGFYYSIEIDQIMDMLDMKGIAYNTADPRLDDPTPTETQPVGDNGGATEDTTPPVTLPPADSTPATETEVTTQPIGGGSISDSDNNNTVIIIVCAAAAVLLVVVIILIVVMSGKKKTPPVVVGSTANTPPTLPQTPSAVPPAVQPVPTPGGYPANTGYAGSNPTFNQPDSGSGDTTLLNVGAGETSVLGGGMSRSSATLVRLKTNTNISVNRPEFIIGKERNRVACCINNNAISRQHAKITSNGGVYFITDLNSSNYTFVNGIQLAPNDPRQLNPGDIIKLADEEFEFRG